MLDRENICLACEGSGMLSDDEGWHYECSICGGKGAFLAGSHPAARIMDVDETNRLLD